MIEMSWSLIGQEVELILPNIGLHWDMRQTEVRRFFCIAKSIFIFSSPDNLVAHVKGPGPVAVIQELVEDLARRCRDLPWNVQCLQCALEVDDPAALHQHRLKTNNTHLLCTFCDSSLVSSLY